MRHKASALAACYVLDMVALMVELLAGLPGVASLAGMRCRLSMWTGTNYFSDVDTKCIDHACESWLYVPSFNCEADMKGKADGNSRNNPRPRQ